MDRPWEFDPVPFVIPPHEWVTLEKGLITAGPAAQCRAGRSLRPPAVAQEGALPPGSCWEIRIYQFACQGIRPSEDTWLTPLCGGSGPRSRWPLVVFCRRTAPSGSGYVLENRIVLSRSLPDDIRDLQVQRLANFYRIFRDNLLRVAPHSHRREVPHIVLLTPGPLN